MEATARKPVRGLGEERLAQVARSCWVIYQKAADAYRVLAHHAMSEELAHLWRGLAEGMRKHVLYWAKVTERVEGQPGLELLGNPYAALQALREVEAEVDRIQESCRAFRSVMDSFYIAYSLEVQLTHPVLCSLPESVMSLPGKEMVKWDYQANLRAFLAGMNKHCPADRLHTAMKDSLERIWSQHKRLAKQESLDPVTGTYNRRSLKRALAAFSSLAERDGYNVALILIGIEGIDELYETLDLKSADEVVNRFYNGIKPVIRVSDVIGRYDFSTFLVYLSKVDQRYLYDIAQRFAESTQSMQKAGIVLSAHIGGAYGPIGGQRGQRLGDYLARALDCLLRARLSRTQRILIE